VPVSLAGFFGATTPDDHFQDLTEEYLSFFKLPTRRGLGNLLFRLVHLRESIAGKGWEAIQDKKKRGEVLTAGEVFFEEMGWVSGFSDLRALVNRLKHWEPKTGDPEATHVRGAPIGLIRTGDLLDQHFFLVDGKDIRTHLRSVYMAYKTWFSRNAYYRERN